MTREGVVVCDCGAFRSLCGGGRNVFWCYLLFPFSFFVFVFGKCEEVGVGCAWSW